LVRASQPLFGASGTTDPTHGFIQGGFIGIALGSWCDEPALVRAHDRQTGVWSNWVNVDLNSEPAT
jgi:hypothetical protein